MNKPWYWPDTQGFLAVAIITIMSAIVLILLLHAVQMTDTVQGVLMTIIGVLAGTLKEVYSYYFSSSSGSKAKDETLKAAVEALPVVAPTPVKEADHVAVH
jgi:hypothetical protein